MMDNVQVTHQGHEYFILDLGHILVHQDCLMLVTKYRAQAWRRSGRGGWNHHKTLNSSLTVAQMTPERVG